uniref:LAGLIDADG endonuclease type 2 n=1 Tax=Amanita thiersii TaxID=235537 RepID=A0A5Q0N2I6_9AGAR|nr:LAGLIDADG endonuclease type 2 [Amanita thiersii]QFZ98713.1 LAGLIDADG endonuclease type 2 [Amanita thiersii]
MKKTLILSKEIRNYRDGYHLNSKYWQEWKQKILPLTAELREIAIGMVLSDACMYKKSNHALIKFEQGYLQEEFLLHLFSIFKNYSFMIEPGRRITLEGKRKGLTKSLWFKSFSHIFFDEVWNLFYVDSGNKHMKIIHVGLIKNHLTDRGLAYWIMGDGSLQKDGKTLILHTQSYTQTENLILSKELNEKFGFMSEVILHKKIYFVIKFNSKDALKLHNLIKPHIHESMRYKIPLIHKTPFTYGV